MPAVLDAPINVLEAAFTRYAYRKAGATQDTPRPRPHDAYQPWLDDLFPTYTTAPLAAHHRRIWEWVWALERGARPRPLVVLLARGGAKSTTAELACVAVGARDARRYILYVSGTQKQADDHVANIAGMLESRSVEREYPLLSQRSLNKFGTSKGWKHNRLRTAAGLTIDALGLDVDVRGIKLDEQRPDLIVFDDVDDAEDSVDPTVRKKIRIITQKILPAGSPDVATLFVQNVVHYESVAARLAGLASEEADFLADREVIGPIPALVGFQAERIPGTVKWRITSGTPTWEGQDRETCQFQINDWGVKAFRSEAQHERTPPTGQAFPEFDPSVHVIDPPKIPPDWARFRAVDYGYAAPFCCLWGARRPDGGLVLYREEYGSGLTAEKQAKQVAILSKGETYKASVGDPSMWAKNREGQRVKSHHAWYRENGVRLSKATNERVAGWDLLHALLDFDDERAPLLQISRDCVNLIRTLPLMVQDANKPEDIDTDLEDHAPDAARYLAQKAVGHLFAGVLKKSLKKRKPPTPIAQLVPLQTNASEKAREQYLTAEPNARRRLFGRRSGY